jgi:mannose-6-phosphate isomerase-like protein (cupin superfamily)
MTGRQTSQDQNKPGGAQVKLLKANFRSPHDVRKPDKAELQVVKVGGASIAKAKMQPGWKWSQSIKPIARTESCMASHFGLVLSGRCHISQDDGTELDLEPGDVFCIPPGHDAWVVGNVPFEAIEFESRTAETYASTNAHN